MTVRVRLVAYDMRDAVVFANWRDAQEALTRFGAGTSIFIRHSIDEWVNVNVRLSAKGLS